MTNQLDSQSFRQKLSNLTVAQQRKVASRFIQNILDIANEQSLKI